MWFEGCSVSVATQCCIYNSMWWHSLPEIEKLQLLRNCVTIRGLTVAQNPDLLCHGPHPDCDLLLFVSWVCVAVRPVTGPDQPLLLSLWNVFPHDDFWTLLAVFCLMINAVGFLWIQRREIFNPVVRREPSILDDPAKKLWIMLSPNFFTSNANSCKNPSSGRPWCGRGSEVITDKPYAAHSHF